MKTAKEWKQFYADSEFRRNYTYEGHDLGAHCTEEGTEFLLWSPCAEAVVLHFYEDGSCAVACKSIRMQKKEKGIWAYRTGQELHGTYYDYEVTIEGETRRTADPTQRPAGLTEKGVWL